jgi:hypothetical protein
MRWRELGLVVAFLAGFALHGAPWGTLIRWAKEDIKKRPKDVI